jgi:hypothetical protein
LLTIDEENSVFVESFKSLYVADFDSSGFLVLLCFRDRLSNSLRAWGLKLNVRGLSDAALKPMSFARSAAKISAGSGFHDIS